ncbi:MAG TPA: DUF4349 domain-containing protein [Pyrinomonadaceae bacterium]|jgi:hypothetical protein
MEKAKFIAVLFFAFSTACVSSSGDVSHNAGNSSANIAMKTDNNQFVNSANSTRTSNLIGGGGGGGREESPLAQQVSLNQAENSQNQPVQIERKIIRHADLNLEANAPEESMAKITAIAESKGGFVVESQQSSSDVKATTRDVVTMTARVPAAKFNETLDEIRKTASRVIVENVKGEDVSEEFIDIEARLKTEKALEQQFLEIMKQAKSVEDALEVQRQLAEVRGEIEKVEGRKRFLENQSSLSTIKIRLQTPTAFSANSTGFSSQLGEAFGKGFDAALGFILGLVTFMTAILPFLLLVVLPLALVIRYFLKKQRKQKMASEIAREEIKNE